MDNTKLTPSTEETQIITQEESYALSNPPQQNKLAPLPDSTKLQAQLEEMGKVRKVLDLYIKDRLSKGIHYSKFHFLKDCKVIKCENPYHVSAEYDITKKGCEQIMEDMRWFADPKPDLEMKAQFNNKPGLICIKTTIWNSEGQFVAQGGGSAQVGAYIDENSAQKRAATSALKAAIKSTGLLSTLNEIATAKESGGAIIAQPIAQTNSISCKCSAGNNAKFHSSYCPLFKKPEPRIEEPLDGTIIEPGEEERLDPESLPI